jgi:hypothetical protein
MATSKVIEHPPAKKPASNPMRTEERVLVDRCRRGDWRPSRAYRATPDGYSRGVPDGRAGRCEDLLQEIFLGASEARRVPG